MRIGVGHPGVKELVQPYVLQNFPAEEIGEWVEPMLDAVAETIAAAARRRRAGAFMSEVARLTAPPKDAEPPKDTPPKGGAG